MNWPCLIVDLAKLRANADTVLGWCRKQGVHAAFVGKGVCADERVLRAVLPRGFTAYADSREENLAGADTDLPKLLLRLAMPDRAEEIVRCADISLQSSEAAIHALGRAAARLGRRHRVILMIDVGDLREGVYFEDRDAILSAARAVLSEPALELYGTGVNLTCYGGIVPDERNLGKLVDITNMLRRELGVPIPLVSGGNSSSLGLLRRGGVPAGVNFLRLGESVLLGTDTATGKRFPELYGDTFVLEAELVEVQEKPSQPVGTSSVNAFGETVTFSDRGVMRRGVLAVGRQDTIPDGLTPVDGAVSVLGSSSDHLLVDLTAAPQYAVGDKLRFTLSYGALLHAFTGKYIAREYREENDRRPASMETVVIALGGNALTVGGKLADAKTQLSIIDSTSTEVADIIMQGYKVVLTHGNGPQVGGIVVQNETAASVIPAMPFDVCGAMSQGMLGYHITQGLQRAMRLRGRQAYPVTVVTQVLVDPEDPKFRNPSKPIGSFYTEEEAEKLTEEKGYVMKEDAGRGWRRVVASPMPLQIIELDAIRCLMDADYTVIAVGGGGIPVYRDADGDLNGIAAVIDKDLASERLARDLDADVFMMLTAVEKCCINFRKPDQQELDAMTAVEAREYIRQGQFAPGSMLPKVEAAIRFVETRRGRRCIITTPDKAVEALAGRAGTLITA